MKLRTLPKYPISPPYSWVLYKCHVGMLADEAKDQVHKGPYIYDIHTEGEGSGSGGRIWTGEGGPAPCGRPHRKLKLESTDVILSSFHAKKLASFLPEVCLWTEKLEIFLRYKLVI